MIKRLTKTSFKAITAVVLALSLVAGGLPFQNQTAEAYTAPGYNGKIVFETIRDGNYEIYSMNADGSNQINLSNHAGMDYYPMWSPDGSRIAFTSNRGGNFDIYVMNSDGTDQTRLTNAPQFDNNPVWSPDGSKISFHSQRDGNSEVYIMNSDGSDQINLSNNTGIDDSQVWSPDSSSLVFRSFRDGSGYENAELYSVNIDGSNQTRLTNAAGYDGNANWSPDGSKISFTSFRDGNDEVYSMDADGSNQLRLTYTDNYMEAYPSYSPDGSQLSFIRQNLDYDHATLIIADFDGLNQQESDYASQGLQIIEWHREYWSPDGTQVLLTGYHESSWETNDLYSFNSDGSKLNQLTFDGSSGGGDWQPIPNTPPVTVSDTLSAPYQTPTLADVLANDTDEEVLSGDNLSVAVQPTNGTASIVDSKIRYMPNNDFHGADSLTYQICDSFLLDQKCSTGVLSITVQAPAAPAVSVGKVAGINFNESTSSYVSSSLRPTFSGIATPGAEVKIEIHSDPIILATTTDGNGNWSVAPTFDLPSGEHMVYISATLNGLTSELGSFGLTVGALANTGESLGWMVLGGMSLVGGSAGLLGLKRKEVMRVRE